MSYEGSVAVDGEGYVEDIESDEESVSDNEDIDNSSTSEEDGEKVEGSINESEEEVVEEDKPEVTDKGTKLAKDPIQQANQLRANAEARVSQYENLLSNPEDLERYLEDLKVSTGYKGKEDVPAQTDQATQDLLSLDPDKIETAEDLKKYSKALRDSLFKEVSDVKKTVSDIVASREISDRNDRLGKGISAIRDKYPELRPKNPDGTPNPLFNEVFDDRLGNLYHKLDFDEKTKNYRGQVDIMDLADSLAEVMKAGKTKGSTEAQTIVKDKRPGRIPQGGSDTSSGVDESKMSPSQMIASRMRRARAKARR